MLEIRLLGPPDIRVDGVPVEVDTQKAIGLLAYLSVEGPTSRDTLATLFWGDSPSQRARATLRRTLSALRAGTGPDIVSADRNRVELTGDVSSDLDDLADELASTSQHGHADGDVCAACVTPLSRATRLYRGDFLSGFAVRDSPDFEDWVRTTGESIRLRVARAFHRLGMARASTGEYPSAIAAVSRWVELDPLHEPAHRQLMLLHAWAGDRPGAIEAYRSCVAVLDQELGVSPLDETTELYEAILDEDLPPAPAVPRRVRTGGGKPAVDSTMLDRNREMERLRVFVDDGPGPGRVIALVGSSWMGKTRLAEELIREQSSTGVAVVMARAFEGERDLPNGVVLQMLVALEPEIQSIRSELADWVLTELNRLDPRLPRGSAGPGADEHGELRQVEAIYTLLDTVLAGRGLLLVIDDVQWLDRASLRTISYLARRIRQLPIKLMVLARARATAAIDLIDSADEIIELGPLTSGDLVGLASEDEAERVIAKTGGVPMLVAEALQGDEDRDEAAPGVISYVESRLRGLTDLSNQVLAAGAVLGGVIDPSLIRDTSGRTEEEVVDAIEELISAGLMREVPDTGELGFSLESVQGIVYESTSLIRRRLLHRRAAEALANRPLARTEARATAMIASHHQRAGSPDAADWFLLAGELSRSVYAHEEAASFYEIALALGSPRVAQIHLALGELAITRGTYRDAIQELRTAASHAEGETLSLAEHRLGDVHRLLGKFELAEEHFQRSEPGNPRPAQLLADWALLHYRLDNHDEARSKAGRALDHARADDDKGEVARALNILALVSEDSDEAVAHVDEALAISPDELTRMTGLNNKAHVLGQIGEHERAIGLVEEAVAIASRTGYRHREAALHNHLADLHHQAGRPAQAEAALTRAVALFADIDSGAWEPEVWLLRHW